LPQAYAATCLDAWERSALGNARRCIALLLEEEERRFAGAEASSTQVVTPVYINMETRIDNLFADLNKDALRFQEL